PNRLYNGGRTGAGEQHTVRSENHAVCPEVCFLIGSPTVAAVYVGLNQFESTPYSPLLASPQGGVAERSKNIAKHPLIAKPGWFSDENKRKTTPSASASVASRNFLDDADTPPCGDARRGITLDSNFFTAP